MMSLFIFYLSHAGGGFQDSQSEGVDSRRKIRPRKNIDQEVTLLQMDSLEVIELHENLIDNESHNVTSMYIVQNSLNDMYIAQILRFLLVKEVKYHHMLSFDTERSHRLCH